MFESSQKWELFGYDMSKLGRQWLAAWRDLLWGNDSPVRLRLDEAVSLRDGMSNTTYHAGQPAVTATVDFAAVLLPDELVLSRQLKLPAAVEDDLPSVISLEVSANSPFAASDTSYGWRLAGRDDKNLSVTLVIVSISAVMTYLAKEYETHDPAGQEVWVEHGGAMLVLQGFGGGRREQKYRHNLVRMGLLLLAIVLLVPALLGLSALMKRLEVQQLQEIAGITQRQAAAASQMRETLMRANANITAANEVVAQYPNPHLEIARLSKLLADDAFIAQFAMNGLAIRLRGQSADAASVMQLLTDTPAYANVTAPQAITRIGGSGLEQFFLNMQVAPEAAQ